MKPKIELSGVILNLIAEIDEFKGGWKYLSFLRPDALANLRRVATIESVGASTRIEGARLSDVEVERLLSGLSAHSFQSRDEEEVAGYAEAMELVFDSYNELTLTENHIRQLHSVLLKHSSKDAWHRGEYKKLPNNVEAFDPYGKSLGVIFETTPPFETPGKMKELVEWTSVSLRESDLHPLLVIAVFSVHFLAVHPFQDRNGRLARILTILLLLRQGYLYVPYASLEAVMEANKDSYYISLRRSQKTLYTDRYNISSWILFFLRALKTQKDNLAMKIGHGSPVALLDLPPLSLQLLELAKLEGRLTLSQAAGSIKANERTIRDHIQKLVKRGYLTKHGDRKATWYDITKA
ncbi:MAG: Fic family protein [Nitrospira sp.]|nr:Fic family protein [Nitrospira sp.]